MSASNSYSYNYQTSSDNSYALAADQRIDEVMERYINKGGQIVTQQRSTLAVNQGISNYQPYTSSKSVSYSPVQSTSTTGYEANPSYLSSTNYYVSDPTTTTVTATTAPAYRSSYAPTSSAISSNSLTAVPTYQAYSSNFQDLTVREITGQNNRQQYVATTIPQSEETYERVKKSRNNQNNNNTTAATTTTTTTTYTPVTTTYTNSSSNVRMINENSLNRSKTQVVILENPENAIKKHATEAEFTAVTKDELASIRDQDISLCNIF